MLRFTIVRRATASLLLASHVLGATGCHTWQTQTGSAESVLASQPVDQRIRVATTSRPEMTLVTGPRVASDTLYGLMDSSTVVTGIALDELTAVQVQKGSLGKTVLLVTGLVVATGVVAGIIGMSQCDHNTIGSVC
jgi:hypothetical protein